MANQKDLRYLAACKTACRADITRHVESGQEVFAHHVKSIEESPFGKRLREAFGGGNNTIIAGKLGVSNSALTNYMRGRVPDADLLLKISDLTNCSVHWLLTGEGTKEISTEASDDRSEVSRRLIAAAHKFDAMPDEKRPAAAEPLVDVLERVLREEE